MTAGAREPAVGWLVVSKEGYGGMVMFFHPSHNMGSLFCRQCGAWGWKDRAARRLCPKPRQTEGVGL